MQETDEFVDKAGHAFLASEVSAHHVEVTEKRVLQRSGVLLSEDVGHEKLHDAETHGEECHVIPRPCVNIWIRFPS